MQVGADNTVWGIHNDTLTTELVDEGFVSLGWDELPDLRSIPNGRDGLKERLAEAHPDASPRSIAGQAGVLFRFRDEVQPGDIVVAPYKPDSTINIGVFSGEYYYEAHAPTHRHRRRVTWKKTGLSRTTFSTEALYEIGSFLTLFRVRTHAEEFLAALDAIATTEDGIAQSVEKAADVPQETDSSDEPSASRIERHTRDFVLHALLRRLSHREFEEFTAGLMRALGYQARVTQYTSDGGVDVIAHRDPLGVEPPLIKIQCKHHAGTVGAPEVQQLAGTQGSGELSAFVTLGHYSRDALAVERHNPRIRLLSGEDVVTLLLEHYERLDERWRTLIPLKRVLVVADEVA